MEDKKPVKYDPSKNYQWEPHSQFFLNGQEFSVMINSLRTVLGSPEAQKILLAEKAAKMLENALARAVEVGVAKEIEKKEAQ